MMAAGSPGVRRRIANTTMATVPITGRVATSRLAMYASTGMSYLPVFLMFQKKATGESNTPVKFAL